MIFYDIMLFTFKRRMDYYVDKETGGTEHVTVFVC